jgi:hypothetical protein
MDPPWRAVLGAKTSLKIPTPDRYSTDLAGT